jgi:hypothetical protein
MMVSGFPTDDELEVEIQKLKVSAMEDIYTAYKQKSVDLLIRALQPYVGIDLSSMPEPDFIYLLAILDKVSYPESTRDFEWHCHAQINGKDCDSLNTETIRYHRPIFLKARPLPQGIRYPLMNTFDRAVEVGGELAQAARWIDSDLNYDQTLRNITYRDLLAVKPYMQITGEQEIKLKCGHCLTPYTVRKQIDPLAYLRVYSPTSIMNMQLNLAVAVHHMVPATEELERLLYWHSCWEKDKNEAEKKRRLEAARAR